LNGVRLPGVATIHFWSQFIVEYPVPFLRALGFSGRRYARSRLQVLSVGADWDSGALHRPGRNLSRLAHSANRRQMGRSARRGSAPIAVVPGGRRRAISSPRRASRGTAAQPGVRPRGASPSISACFLPAVIGLPRRPSRAGDWRGYRCPNSPERLPHSCGLALRCYSASHDPANRPESG